MTDVTLHYAVPIEASSPPESLPSVCAVIPTRNRPELLRRAVLGALEQDYAGDLQVIVVLDQADANALERLPASPRIKVLTNTRKAGLAGARNTGIMASTADLIAFCDDDDAWRPNKIANQVDALLAQPSANFVSCSIEVDFEGKRSVRLAGANRITHAELRSSRMSMLHSSTFLIRREALLGDLGLIDEGIPGSHNEDWDVLLRASRLSPIVHVDQPLVQVQWTSGSHFNRAWDQKDRLPAVDTRPAPRHRRGITQGRGAGLRPDRVRLRSVRRAYDRPALGRSRDPAALAGTPRLPGHRRCRRHPRRNRTQHPAPAGQRSLTVRAAAATRRRACGPARPCRRRRSPSRYRPSPRCRSACRRSRWRHAPRLADHPAHDLVAAVDHRLGHALELAAEHRLQAGAHLREDVARPHGEPEYLAETCSIRYPGNRSS